jgi:hypothetical protein
MNLTLAQYQDGFAQLLLAELPEGSGAPGHAPDHASLNASGHAPDHAPSAARPSTPHPAFAALARQPGFAVYRNTVLKGCVDALAANYPAVCRLVGEEWFRAAAALYARAHPPSQPALIFYGADFADFLAAFEPAAELPYLPGVALLDRLWTEAHCAPDGAAADAQDMNRLAQLPPDVLLQSVLRPHPAARWRWFGAMPIYTLWHHNRAEREVPDEIEWQGEGALLTRPQGAVNWYPASRAQCAFLDACAHGLTVAQAAQAALDCDAQADLPALIGALLAAGAFAAAAPEPAGSLAPPAHEAAPLPC